MGGSCDDDEQQEGYRDSCRWRTVAPAAVSLVERGCGRPRPLARATCGCGSTGRPVVDEELLDKDCARMASDRRTSRPFSASWRPSPARLAADPPVRRSSISKGSLRRARCTSSGITAACLTFPPGEHRLLIHGLVDRPLTFDLASLSRYPLVSRIHFIECSGNSAGLYAAEPPQGGAGALHGLVSCSEWTGVPLGTLLDEAGVRPAGKWLLAEGARRRRDESQHPDREGAGRRDDRDLSERRAPAARERVSDAAPAARAGKATRT